MAPRYEPVDLAGWIERSFNNVSPIRIVPEKADHMRIRFVDAEQQPTAAYEQLKIYVSIRARHDLDIAGFDIKVIA